MKKCPKCGNGYGDNIKFCQVDGTPLEKQSQKKCPGCRTENDSDAKFCCECGHKLGTGIYVCTKCGAEYEKAVKFCKECGGKVIEDGTEDDYDEDDEYDEDDNEDYDDEDEDYSNDYGGEDEFDDDEELPHDMVYVEGGTMWLGSNYEKDNNPMHKVTLDSFYISKYQVTQELWNSVMNYDNSIGFGRKRPVNCVSWYDAVEFCNQLSKKEGLAPCYKIYKNRKDPYNENDDADDDLKWTVKCNFMANGYRLPTEAEWEYAARGGQKSRGYKYAGSNNIDEVAWYGYNSGRETHNVGEKKPNELGIYDMTGNVCEWCWDWYDKGIDGGTNPAGPHSGSLRVMRGECCNRTGYMCFVSFRYCDMPMYRGYINRGFRVVRSQ